MRCIATILLELVYLIDLQTDRKRISCNQIEAAAKQWSSSRLNRQGEPVTFESVARFIRYSTRWLSFLGRHEQPEALPRHSHSSEVAAFAHSMKCDRGWSEKTVVDYCRLIDRFFEWLDERSVALERVRISDIDCFLSVCRDSNNCSRRTLNNYALQLRSFFRFAMKRRWCQPGIADGIAGPRFVRGETVPKGVSREEALKMLAAIDENSAADLRNRAVLQLLVTYGLRAGEAADLRLEDIDWQQDLLRIRCSKPGRTVVQPLSESVGEPILCYLRNVRPESSHRNVFLTLVAPIRPLSQHAVRHIVARHLSRVGIVGKGPHTLRHCVAQHLLDQGLPIKTIGDYLGHRSTAATSVYAKVNLKALREVAEIDLGGVT